MAESKPKDENVLKEKVHEYKQAHPEALPDCDFAFLLKTIDKMSDSSKVKAARNAFNEKREWKPGTETWNVGKVYLAEDRSITFALRREGEAITIEELRDQLAPIEKKVPVKSTVPVMLALSDERRVQITDLYAHSLISEKWAGMPVDFVLCFNLAKPAWRNDKGDGAQAAGEAEA